MSGQVIDMWTREEHIPVVGADLDKLAKEYFEDKVSLVVETLETIMESLACLQESDYEVIAEAIKKMPLSNITLACLELRRIANGER